MTNRISVMIAGVALLAFAGSAFAEPLKLTGVQLDRVNAGGVGLANAAALALGEVTADTATQTSTNVSTSKDTPVIAIGQAFSQSLAIGGFLFNAAAISHADTAASLP
jgi:hypothetical protein